MKRAPAKAMALGGVGVLWKRFSAYVFIGISCLTLLISIIYPSGVSGFRSGVADTFMPVLSAMNKPFVNAAQAVRNFSGLSDLQAENARLTQENVRLREWYETALLLEAENKSLRDLLNVKIEPEYKAITARILSDSQSSFAKSMLISAGQKDGVQKGQAVMAGNGLIGRIIEVEKTTSRVLLITDLNSRIPVLIEDTRQHAIMAGDNQDNTYLRHLPADSAIKEGARVITSGQGGLLPYGLPIGKIIHSQSAGYNVGVAPFAQFDSIVHVRVLNKDPVSSLSDIETSAGERQ